jgi:hypothetical protein
MPLKTLFLNPPSFEKFDGGASSRWPATREIESYWYPVWLAYANDIRGTRTGVEDGRRVRTIASQGPSDWRQHHGSHLWRICRGLCAQRRPRLLCHR